MSTPAAPTQNPLPFIDPQQMTIDDLGPVLGGRYRRNGTGTIAVVLRIEQRRKQWVWVRMHGTEQMLTVAGFLGNFTLS
jgi:hypothetical protein